MRGNILSVIIDVVNDYENHVYLHLILTYKRTNSPRTSPQLQYSSICFGGNTISGGTPY